ncbi:MAG TPA: T9SS type A sorting domain-containing protein, partial [Ignavibacteriaceae bacterium]|nr:T9SS type A sorting domain-containing protein [Ignavibacteriaceae bacterium]
MRKLSYTFALALTSFFLFAGAESYAQAVQDPASINVYEASGPITVDGVLDETSWLTASPQIMFKLGGEPSGLSNTPTNGAVVKPPYTDSSTTYVKYLYSGTNLYVSLKSDDKQVCKFDWEGDGMFMILKNPINQNSELKLYVINSTTFGAETGGAAPIPTGSYGGVGVVNGTIYDSTDVDGGYTAEAYIDLSALGYPTLPATLQVSVVIFDPDNYSAGAPPWGPNGNFYKQWWGSEWGSEFRTLNFVQGTSPYDPPSITVYGAQGVITVDGLLNEPDWAFNVPQIMFKKDGVPSGNNFTPTNGVVVKPPYTDESTTYVKYLYSGTNLYVALQSNDQQVCKFDWEGDGMFMILKNPINQNSELKLYVINSTTFGAETGGAAPIPTGSYGGVGVVNGTIYDSTDVDGGYTAEAYIDLSALGYPTLPATLQVSVVIFDPDNYSAGAPPWGPNGNFYKQWWGSEWGSEFKTLVFGNVVPVELTSFTGAFVGNDVQLKWATATELNNRGFEIQRSINNSEFATIAFVEGHGTTTEQKQYTFVDRNVTTRVNCAYRLKQIDFNGTYEYSKVVNLGYTLPLEFTLEQNYPNPFNPTTNIIYAVPVKSNVTLDVYNLIGQKVVTLFEGEVEAGKHTAQFNASTMSSGIYFFRLNAVGQNGAQFTSSKKMTLL